MKGILAVGGVAAAVVLVALGAVPIIQARGAKRINPAKMMVPIPPGGSVVKQLQPMVNLQWTKITVVRSPMAAAETLAFYRETLVGQGWAETASPVPASGPERAGVGGKFKRHGLDLSVHVFADTAKETCFAILQVHPSSRQGNSELAVDAVVSRLHGFPVFPGVKKALLIEDSGERTVSTVLYDAEASPREIAEFYRHSLKGENSTTASSAEWSSHGYIYQGKRALINLCRRRGGDGTSVMVILSGAGQDGKAGVGAWSTDATF